ncbi:MAG: hypothetical protein JST22_15270 [Bacteroidetes bacterium]|nr:hypothetical protein [Bacteroidota bacterium]
MKRMLLLLALAIAPIILCAPGCDISPTGPNGTDVGSQFKPTKGEDSTAHAANPLQDPYHPTPVKGGTVGDASRIPSVVATIFQPNNLGNTHIQTGNISIRPDSINWKLDFAPEGDMPIEWVASIDKFPAPFDFNNYVTTTTSSPSIGTWEAPYGATTIALTNPDLEAEVGMYYRVTIRYVNKEGAVGNVEQWFTCVLVYG